MIEDSSSRGLSSTESKGDLLYDYNMFSFFLRNLSSSWVRTVSIVLATFVSACIWFVFYFIYINISSGIAYYTLDGIDEQRFSITAGSNIFQLFDREKWWIPQWVLEQISADKNLERYKEFRFLDISVLGKFDLFKFSLDIDIPTFSIRDSIGWTDWIGISSRMLKYYNLEFAWSHAFFPVFSEADIVGRGVTLVFGASKLFSLPEKSENAYTSKITHIDSDYPGFGVVIPYDVADREMRKLRYIQWSPYKVVAYMSDVSSRAEIESLYSGYILKFDADTIVEQKRTLETVARILAMVMLSIIVILYGFLFLLFSWYFREKEYVFSLIRQYKIENMSRYILVFLEPILLIFVGILSYILVCFVGQWYVIWLLQGFLQSKNIFFPLLSVSYSSALMIGWLSLTILIGLVILAYNTRKK